MKKAILILTALVMMASGVAAVSAYEAHIVNVTAHVENAMSVQKDHLTFGTVFPEEWLTDNFTVGVSGSFCSPDQQKAYAIDYAIWVEWKLGNPDPAVVGSDNNSYYPWLGDALYIGIFEDATTVPASINATALTWVGPAPSPGPPGATWLMNSPKPLRKWDPKNLNDMIVVGLDVPVFEGFYNPLTDPEPKPSGKDDPTWIILKSDTVRYHPDGIDLGVDIKIQITKIYRIP